MSAVDATDVACGVGNLYGGHVYTGSDRDTIELGIRRLLAGGYRILAPGEVDRETVERCEEVAEAERRLHDTGSGFDSQPAREAAFNIATAIRTLTDGGHDA